MVDTPTPIAMSAEELKKRVADLWAEMTTTLEDPPEDCETALATYQATLNVLLGVWADNDELKRRLREATGRPALDDSQGGAGAMGESFTGDREKLRVVDLIFEICNMPSGVERKYAALNGYVSTSGLLVPAWIENDNLKMALQQAAEGRDVFESSARLLDASSPTVVTSYLGVGPYDTEAAILSWQEFVQAGLSGIGTLSDWQEYTMANRT